MIRIRLANSRDWRDLAELRYEFRAEIGSVSETKSAFVKRCALWMRRRFRASAWRCWVADNRNGLVGHVCVQLIEKMPNPVNEPETHAYVTNCYVIPEMRNRGVGKKLLNRALAWCRAQKTDAIILWPNPASKSLYLRAGFGSASDLLEIRHRKSHRHHRSKQ
jgi:GNAT superfamily N-acetyltransferase